MSVKFIRRGQLQAKIDRVHAVRIKSEQFVDAKFQGVLKIDVELSLAADDLSSEFGNPTSGKSRAL